MANKLLGPFVILFALFLLTGWSIAGAETLELMNVWHIPVNQEPPTVTMRNPLQPQVGDEQVYIYCGGFPQGTIWAGTLHYRESGAATWESSAFAFDSNQGNNEYWLAILPNAGFLTGDVIEYYLAMEGDSVMYELTYVYGDDDTSYTTADQGAALADPFSYTLPSPQTPTPAPTPEPQPLLNVWHIPVNNEPPSVTMRNPLAPREGDDTIYVYCGGYPISTIWSGTLLFRIQGAASWSTSEFTFDSNQGDNEYWVAEINSTGFEAGEVIEYYLQVDGDPESSRETFVYGEDEQSFKTENREVAKESPYSFTVLPNVTPTPNPETPTPTPEPPPLINVWHIPVNSEPPGVTMRNPLQPHIGDENVYLYTGGYPQGTIWSGTLYFRLTGEPSWSTAVFSFDSNQGNNEYWLAFFSLEAFIEGDIIEYYIEMNADPEIYRDTFLYGDNENSYRTGDWEMAADNPYSFTLTAFITPTPGPETPTPTPQPPPLMNVWHIPVNSEPPGVTMRNPLQPKFGDDRFYIYGGGYPQGVIWTGILYYREANEISWTTAAFFFDSNQGNNEYWIAEGAIAAYAEGDIIQYYLEIEGDPETYQGTFIYGDNDHSYVTGEQSEAADSPYSFTIASNITPTPGPETPTPTSTALPAINAWHIPVNEEPPGVTMRNPLYPGSDDDSVYIYAGAYPEGTVWAGSVFYRRAGETSYQLATLNWDSNQSGNEYWIAGMNNSLYEEGDTIEYYIMLSGDPESYSVTFVFGEDNTSYTSIYEQHAQDDPFTYIVYDGSASPTPTTTPEFSATPTAPPATYTPTPTPPSGDVGVTLEMPAHEFKPGDVCWLNAHLFNFDQPLSGVKLVAFLDIGIGEYWFWPGWKHYPPEVDYQVINLPVGEQSVSLIDPFTWPGGAGTASGLYFHSAILNPEFTEIIGTFDSWLFGYGV